MMMMVRSVATGFGRYGMPCPSVTPTFDHETGLWVASKVGNLHSKFGHARPLGSWIILYVCDGRTDRQTDRQKKRLLPLWSLLFPAGQAAIKLPSAEASKQAQCMSPGQYTPYIKGIIKTP